MQQCRGEAMVRNGSGVGGSAVRKGSSANASANASGADFGMLAPHAHLVGSLIGFGNFLDLFLVDSVFAFRSWSSA